MARPAGAASRAACVLLLLLLFLFLSPAPPPRVAAQAVPAEEAAAATVHADGDGNGNGTRGGGGRKVVSTIDCQICEATCRVKCLVNNLFQWGVCYQRCKADNCNDWCSR